MPQKLPWTEAQDLRLKRLRAEGVTWDAIAAILGVSRYTAIERGRKIGARRPPPEYRPPPEDPAREPLPPGHPRTWGAITAGTTLEGCPYPLPWFP
jgi:DNA-binding XRE family transcriptional regulator